MGTIEALGGGYHRLAPGTLASVVTYFEMRESPQLPPERDPVPWTLERIERIGLERYRDLYRRVGAAYLWGARLRCDDAELASIVHDPDVSVYVLRADARDSGILELDFRSAGACEIVYFGVERSLIGTGAGRWLMRQAIRIAWAAPIARLWLHTCTLDHPDAPRFYARAGFTPYRREVEVCDDPRALGVLPPDAAPQVPRL